MAGRIYMLILSILLLNGCARFENTGFLYPDTVTMNGDGLNETWGISYVQTTSNDTLLSLTLKIYNQHNDEVFFIETKSTLVHWYPKPGAMSPGMYYFKVTYEVSSAPGEKKLFWGEFKLIN